ncbi:MAG: AMP-binding protein [Desulfatiglans sp.]|jgi:long-chain acyl-CoA synthetase|nr:AMP-binding protein [Thermodesulfobacteriota bacterium]MEE4351388.1 AMP-binding protein [Desulfatiglans sp.]
MTNVNIDRSDSGRTKEGGSLDSIPKLFRRMCQERSDSVAMRKKAFGIWNEYTWENCYQNVKHFALGMVAMGFGKGDKICIIGDNDPQWFWAELAAQAVGGISVGIYIDSVPEEIQYIAAHSESVFALAKDQEQCDKFLQITDQLPNLKKIIYWDPSGMWAYKENQWIMQFDEVLALGEKFDREHPGFYEKKIDEVGSDDLAILSYTSGTTGFPKGVMVTHGSLIWGAVQMSKNCNVKSGDEYLSFVSPAWIAEQLLGIMVWVYHGITVNFPEEPETVMQDLREIGAAFFLFGPKQWEDLLSMVQIRLTDTTLIRSLVYKMCMPIGYKVAEYELARKKIPAFWKSLYSICMLICFRPIRDYLGLRKLKIGLTGGSLLGPDTFKWFRALGVNLSEVYGASEITPVSIHGREVNLGTIGHLTDGVEAQISDEGELLVRSPALFKGYYKDPDTTAEKITPDGWFHTGDACTIKDGRELIYLDRVKDLLSLKGGAKYSATYIENRLKFSHYIKDVMIIGDETREFLLAMIVIDFNNVGRWAEKSRIPYTTLIDLSQKQEVYELILPELARVNETLPKESQIKRFINLPKEFDADEGELTRTRKLKRSVLWEKYMDLIDAAYGGKNLVVREAEVKYRDGRKGKIRAELKIMDVGGNNI